MKITMTLLMLLALLLPNAFAQDNTQMNLPKGAVARFDKGIAWEILYSPDSTRFAVESSIGIWLYDTMTGQEVALVGAHMGRVLGIAFSPDGKTVASGHIDRAVRLWDTETGEPKGTLTGHTRLISGVVFQSGR